VASVSGTDDPAVLWEIIKEQIKGEKRWVYSLVKNLGIERENTGGLCIKVEPIKYDMLVGFSDYLSSKVKAFFGSEQKFRFLCSPDASQANCNKNLERICEILVKEFGGKVISDN